MALNLFTQKTIERIDVHEIPEEFINYYEDLNSTERQRINELRPDLASALGYGSEIKHIENSSDTSVHVPLRIIDTSDRHEEKKVSSIDLTRISKNIYAGVNIREEVKKGLNPLELLTIRNDQEKCKIHRKPFEKMHTSYQVPSSRRPGIMATLGISPWYCSECNRLYVVEGHADGIEEKLSAIDVSAHVYSLKETNAYVRSQLPSIEVLKDECIYYPDVWIEEKTLCPIHNERLEEYSFYTQHEKKKVRFKAYICDSCNKIMMRRTKLLDLEDQCAAVGVPMPMMRPLIEKPKKKKTPKRELTPHYYVENGKRKEYHFNNVSDFYLLQETDTVVVSDSTYCNLLGHETEEVMIVFAVNQKRGGRKYYLCLAGYCSQCQKYYMSEADYRVIYPIGRPEITIIRDLEDEDYLITSGEVFDLEKCHLEELEGDLERKTNEIYNADDYVNPYKTYRGGYDDGGLQYSKAMSKNKYEKVLEKWNGYKPKPYTYRVDLSGEGGNLTYYLGPSDIQIDDHTRVISYNDRGFGAKLANYRTVETEIHGKNYKVKLSRQFDIANSQLYGYTNLRTDEDTIFRAGITDPFLIKVLNLRKKQHNLVDIIATIQENQNTIVDEKFRQNIVVQGCAGSGKTMVLLHRLSSLKYNHPEYDFGEALILTPNDQFNLHIEGLADGLQIGFINRVSVEQYYIQTLALYSNDFVPKNEVASEVFVNQSYVDYIYSDAFKKDMDSAYESVMSERRDAFVLLQWLCEEIEENYPANFGDSESDFIPVISSLLRRISRKIEVRENVIASAEAVWKDTEKKINDVSLQRSLAELKTDRTLSQAIPIVYEKLGSYLTDIIQVIEEQKEIIQNTAEEKERIESRIFLFRKAEKLAELQEISDAAKSRIELEQAKLEEVRPLVEKTDEKKSVQEILEWMRRATLYVPEVQEEINNYERCVNRVSKLQEEKSELEYEAEKQKTRYETVEATRYSDNIKNALTHLVAKTEEYTEYATFTKVFYQAVSAFREKNKIKVNKGIHRYDLYAAILFCIRFYGKTPGKSHFICVDEGQDMSINEYRLIYALNQRDVIFNVYGDVNQLLKPGRGILDWNELKNEFSMKEFRLNENYRNTNQITRFCNDSFEMTVLQTGVDGAKVREIPRRDLEKEISELNLGAEKTAILVPRSVMRKSYLNRSILPVRIRNAISQKIDNGLISFMYVDEVKGIEFDKVFVVSNKMTKNEKYIAYTRALSELVIVVDESISDREVSDYSAKC